MERFFKDLNTLQRMRTGPLNEYMDQCAQRLCDLGYKRFSGRIRLRRLARFGRWLKRRGIGLDQITPELVESYLNRHGKVKDGDAVVLDWVLAWLRDKHVIREMPASDSDTPARQLEKEFASYLEQERRLAPMTIEDRRRFVRRFLVHRFGHGQPDLSKLCRRDVVDFVREQAEYQPKRAHLLTTALRSFFTYLRYQGQIATDLAAAVPAVANWSLSSLPKALPAEQVELLLTHCRQKTPMGLRDYAVLLLLARLGLRAGEVASLTLDDIDWDAGQIRVCGKGGRCSELPLPADVGEAIADYLQHGRQRCSGRLVFLRAAAPVGGFKGQSAVGLIVKHALVRAGIQSPRKGAHQLRHALATQMLSRGASLAEIGELLRHSSPRTTSIYAKVDLPALRPLALPWPGGEQ
jgi:site-specific recombinase XerD